LSAEPTQQQLDAALELRRNTWLFDDQIAHEVGLDGATLRATISRGMRDDPSTMFAQFAANYIQASNDIEIKALDRVACGIKGWESTAWLLERWAPRRWGKLVPVGGPREKVDIGELIDEIAARQRTLSELMAAPPPELLEAMRANAATLAPLLCAESDVTPRGEGAKRSDE
jgi:hypothetical protein